MAGSPVIQGQSETSGRTPRPIASSQKPIFNAPSWQTPPNSSDHLHTQTRSRDETIVPTVCLLGVWSDSSYLHASADRDNQYLGRIAKLLLTHPYNTPNILAKSCWKSPQPTILQYVPVFALQIMRHDNLKENARWFSKKHTRYWTANLLGRVQPNWQQLGWLPYQEAPTLHWRGWPAFAMAMGCRSQHYFILQPKSTLGLIDIDQFHSNAIYCRWFHRCCRWWYSRSGVMIKYWRHINGYIRVYWSPSPWSSDTIRISSINTSHQLTNMNQCNATSIICPIAEKAHLKCSAFRRPMCGFIQKIWN